MIIGNYQYTIDEKGRVKLPNDFKNSLESKMVITLGIDNTLEIRSKTIFDAWLNELLSKGSFSKQLRIIQRSILGNSFEIEFDNQGRIKIPKVHLAIIDSKQIQIIGVGNKVELMSIQRWDEFMKETGNDVIDELLLENYNNGKN